MSRKQKHLTRHRWYALLAGGALACGGLLWQASRAQEPIGWMYSHDAGDFAYDHLSDVPSDEVVPRSLADDRVRQFDELDRPRFAERVSHRATQLNEERFTVVATTGEEDARLARSEFAAAWNEFSELADTFTRVHRNPDFGLGQLVIIIDGEPLRERDQPEQTVQIQNGQTVVYLNVSDEENDLEEQVPRLHQAAVQALLHLAELDRKLPLWAQEGLAQYTADKLEKEEAARAAAEKSEDEEGLEPDVYEFNDKDETDPTEIADDEQDPPGDADAGEEGVIAKVTAPAGGGMKLQGGEYWRLKRAEQDKLEAPDEDEEDEPSEALERVRFLLEGEDGKYAPAFLLAIREMAAEPTDPELASRQHLFQTQLLPPPTDTLLDELSEELEPQFREWQTDPLRGQPLFLPGGEIPDPAMLSRQKEMEVVLKLARRVDTPDDSAEVQLRITEFGPEGQREIEVPRFQPQALNTEQIFHQLTSGDAEPWATLDADGRLLLWGDHKELAEALGIDEQRYSSAWRDGKWVLVSAWDNATQLEAWLEDNPNNPERPLMKFAARPRE